MGIHEQFTAHGRNAKKSINECKMLLPEIERRMIWQKKGYGSIYEYAAKLACLSRGQVDDALRIMRRIENKPELIKVARMKSLNAVRPVASIATEKTQKLWAEKAQKMTKNALELFVRQSRTSTEKQAQTIEMKLSQEVEEELKKLKGDGEWETLMKELLEARKTLLEQEKPKPANDAERYMSKKIEKWVIKTTNGQCAEPGCNKKYYALHHQDSFAINRVHDPDRIKPLCKNHHELAHQSDSRIDRKFRLYKLQTMRC